MAAGPDLSEAQPARSVIQLSCPFGAEALCRELALALATTGSVIRRIARGGEPPTRPGDLGLALTLGTGQGALQLLWYHAGDATAHRTPGVTSASDPATDAAALLKSSFMLRRALDSQRPVTP